MFKKPAQVPSITRIAPQKKLTPLEKRNVIINNQLLRQHWSIPVVPSTVLNVEEVRKTGGKIRSLTQLMKNPRMRMPELQKSINHLMHNLKAIEYFGCFPYNQDLHKRVKYMKDMNTVLENFLIRVVLKGDSCEKAAEDTRNAARKENRKE